ncbi:MAG TPA: hypothetical protein VMU51_15895 [Mycobacteriales bacterium]|nr:hypothetical protein [Mycobacteriales bacterium]
MPDHWTVLDLEPATCAGWVDHFLAQHALDLPGIEWARAGDVLRLMIEQHQQAGVLFAAVLGTRAPTADGLVAAGLALAWQELAGMDLAELEEFCRQDEPGPGEDLSAREVSRVRLRHGEALRVRSRQSAPIPLTPSRRPVAIVQHLLLVPGSPWLGVFSLTTPHVDRAEEYADLADRVARSLVLLDDSGQPLATY